MKKTIAVLLSIVLAFSGICSTLLLPATAEITSFEDPSKWVIYDSSVDHVNSTAKLAAAWASVTQNTDAQYVCDGNSSLRVVASWQVPTHQFNVEKNTDYTLSFKYLDPASPAATPLASAGVINNDYDISWGNAYDEGYYSRLLDSCYYESNGNFSQRVSKWDLNVSTNYVAGDWNEITLNFNSYDNETLTFLIINSANPFYLDDFKLIKKGQPEPEPKPEPEPEPEPTTSEAEKWQIYLNSEKEAIDGTANNRAGWNSVTDNTDPTLNCGELPTVKFYGSHSTMARPLSLENGKKYKISFKYYMPDSTIPSESGEALFYQIGITEKGTALSTGGGSRPVKATLGDSCVGEKNNWQEYSFEYSNTTATEKYFFIFSVFSGGYTFYFADLKVEDITPEPEPEPEPNVPESQKRQIYKQGGPSTLDGTATIVGGWMNATDNEDPAFNYKGIQSVKIYGNTSTFARTLKGLEAGKTYKVSFKYFMPETTTPYGCSENLLYETGIVSKGATLSNRG